MRILLDTNRLTDFFSGDRQLAVRLESAVEVWVPFIAIAEIKSGFAMASRPGKNQAILETFLQRPGIDVLYADRATIDVYAMLFHQLRRAGTPIPNNALWIGSLAVQHQLVLMTRDKHFRALPQVLRADQV